MMPHTQYLRCILFFSLCFVLLLPATLLAEEEISDPLESVNRGIFWFNDQLDQYFFEPVAEAYDYITPDIVQKGITNFYRNLATPVYIVSDIAQLKFEQVGLHTGRCIINTTFGVGGFIDVAEKLGTPHHEEDFGAALGYWGVPSGPYLVLPLLGPSNLRDLAGYGVDVVAHPGFWFRYADFRQRDINVVSGVSRSVDLINTRANLLDAVDTAKESSLDYYLFAQNAYQQYRQGVIYDGMPPEEDWEDEWEDEEDIERE